MSLLILLVTLHEMQINIYFRKIVPLAFFNNSIVSEKIDSLVDNERFVNLRSEGHLIIPIEYRCINVTGLWIGNSNYQCYEQL